MNKKLDEILYNKYPKLFIQKDLDMTQTCLCWGIECGDGWFDIIDRLCEKIQNYIDTNNIAQLEFVQVKEKYGGLRVYVNYYEETIEAFIEEAISESYNTCEECGSKEKVTQTKGWIVSLCEKCMKEASNE